MRLLSVLFVSAFLVLGISKDSFAAKRIALIIGNGAYTTTSPLPNPPNDAKLMADTLSALGFEVMAHTDTTQKQMKRALSTFAKALKDAGPDGVGLFFYAGHGVQVGGENYLLPVDAAIDNEADVEIEAVSANKVMAAMEYARNALNFVVLDACRNNPFARGFRSNTRGLAQIDAPRGSLIAYATSPGNVAADGSGDNSPYTTALVQQMKRPGLAVEEMFRNVRVSVMEETKDKQVPWESSSLTGAFYFTPPDTNGGGDQVSGGNDTPSEEILFWKSVSNSNDITMYKAYLDVYPEGVFAVIARKKIEILGGAPTVTATQQAVTQPTVTQAEPTAVVTLGGTEDLLKPGRISPPVVNMVRLHPSFKGAQMPLVKKLITETNMSHEFKGQFSSSILRKQQVFKSVDNGMLSIHSNGNAELYTTESTSKSVLTSVEVRPTALPLTIYSETTSDKGTSYSKVLEIADVQGHLFPMAVGNKIRFQVTEESSVSMGSYKTNIFVKTHDMKVVRKAPAIEFSNKLQGNVYVIEDNATSRLATSANATPRSYRQTIYYSDYAGTFLSLGTQRSAAAELSSTLGHQVVDLVY